MMNNAESWIKVIEIPLIPPSLRDNTADVDRLIKGIKKEIPAQDILVDYDLIKRIPVILRESGYKATPILYESKGLWHLIDLLGPGKENIIYGVSADIGTSTVVLRLLNLVNGKTLDETSFLNPQIAIGPDIITRIHFASKDGGLGILQGMLIERINQEIKSLAKDHGIDIRSIVGMSIAGNTTMTHLFLGLNPYWICREPYIPVINSPGLVRSSDLGLLTNPRAPVLVLPGAGSYLGGDIIAGVLTSNLYRQDQVGLLLDVGTNAEVVLGNREWLMACAGAAGPALEGGIAKTGMMAGPGAIDKVFINPESRDIQYRTIDNLLPVGICGSGMIDMTAQLFLSGMIDQRGKFIAEACGDRLIEVDGNKYLVVVPSSQTATGKNLTLGQVEIDALLRSKAAMYTILTTITRMINLSMKDIGQFYIAGTFGSYINPRSAISIGMIPDIPEEKYQSLGNTSLNGASMALLSFRKREAVYYIRDRITYIELNVNQDFMNNFNAAKFIPHTDRDLFPSVRPG